jgi:prepilin-type N-terminal cleavage/methylation domain-containing protein/prepilin-type processing-associated H-X9-DG protein
MMAAMGILPHIGMGIGRRRALQGIGARGFTIIELLIVLGIIAVLAGLLFPMLARAQHAAKRVLCVNNMHQLGLGMLAYASDFAGAVPWDGWREGDTSSHVVGFWNDPSIWFNAAAKYACGQSYSDMQVANAANGAALPKSGDAGLFVCPEADPASPGPKDDVVSDGYFMMWGWDPAAAPAENPIQRKTYWCYCFNTQLDGGIEDRDVGYRVVVRLTQLSQPAQTVLLLEKLMRPGEFTPPYGGSVMQSEGSYNEFTTRHDGGGNILMADFHIEYFTRNELINVPNAPIDYNQPGKVIWNPFGQSN